MTTEAGTPPAGTPPAGTPPAGTPPAGTPPAAPWYGTADEATVGYIKNKGWEGPADVIRSYQGAEKLIGRDPSTLLTLPKQGDTDGWNALYAKLGRPESADKYDFKAGLPDGAQVDENFAKTLGGLFHGAGVSAEQAKVIAAGYNQYVANQQAEAAKNYDLNVQSDKKALLQKWGGGYERQMNSAQMAVAALEFPAEVINAIEGALGYAGTMELFANLGKRFSEDKFRTGDSQPRFDGQMTPAEAGAEINKLKQDEVFQKTLRDKLHPSHKDNYKRWQQLFAIAYPE